MRVIIPFLNIIGRSIEMLGDTWQQMVFGIMDIQVIYHQGSARFKTTANGTNSGFMFTPGPEIAKAGKEIKRMIAVIFPEWQPHIVNIKMDIVLFKLFGIFNACR